MTVDLTRLVKPLEWHKSHMRPWDDDWHTVPTGYTVRCADEWGWKWSSPLGAFGHASSPTAAQAAANADRVARVLAAIDTEAIAALVEALQRYYQSPCPDCSGDCGSANPPVACCLPQQARTALARVKGQTK